MNDPCVASGRGLDRPSVELAVGAVAIGLVARVLAAAEIDGLALLSSEHDWAHPRRRSVGSIAERLIVLRPQAHHA